MTSFATKAASVVLWGQSLAFLALATPPLTALNRRFGATRVDPLTRAYTRTQVALTLCRFQTHVHPDVKPDQTYLFVQNHVNVLDYCTMYVSTPHVKQGMELLSHFRIPFYGPFMESRGTIPMEPGSAASARAVLRRMKEEVAAGRSLLAFPEGTRSRDGRVHPFQTGIFQMARSLGVPVVPIAVTGMSDVLCTGSWIMRPFQQVHVHALAPIPTAGLDRAGADALAATCEALIREKVDAWIDRREVV